MNEYTPSTAEVRDGWVCLIFDGGACEAAKLDSNWSQDRAEAQFDRWLAEVERAAAEKLEAELEARIEDRDYWYKIATEAKDQRDAALSAIANVKGFAEGLMHDGTEPYLRIGKMILTALGSVPSTGEGNE